LANVKSFSH